MNRKKFLTNKDLGKIKGEIIKDIKNNRKSCRWIEIPLIAIMFIIIISLTFAANYFISITISLIKSDLDIKDIPGFIRILYPVICGLIGLVVFKLIAKLSEISESYLQKEKKFTGYINLIRIAHDKEEINDILIKYFNDQNFQKKQTMLAKPKQLPG